MFSTVIITSKFAAKSPIEDNNFDFVEASH